MCGINELNCFGVHEMRAMGNEGVAICGLNQWRKFRRSSQRGVVFSTYLDKKLTSLVYNISEAYAGFW